MASVAQVQRPANPMLTISQIAQGLSRVGLTGQQIQNMAAQQKLLPAQQKHMELANKLAAIQAQYAPQMMQSKMQSAQAANQLAQFKVQNPLLGVGGAAGQIGAANYLKQQQNAQPPQVPFRAGQQPNQSDQAQLILSDLKAKQDYQKSMGDYRKAQTTALPFSLLPSNVRAAVLARAKGTGQDYLQAARNLVGGQSLQDIANTQGVDLTKTPAIYAPTTATKTTVQGRGMAVNTIDSLNNNMSQALAPYGTRIFGYNPTQVAQMITGSSPDSQARLIAAYALQPELQNARNKASGGRMSVKLVDEMTNKAIGKLKLMRLHVSPQVFLSSQAYMNKWISDAYNASLQSISPTPQNLTGSGTQVQSDRVGVYDKNGNYGTIPKSQLSSALKSGYRTKK